MAEPDEDNQVMISAVEHYSYCPRQCALIHVEQVYDENLFTLRGSMAHERVDEPTERTEDGIVIERALPIWSGKLGVFGRADVVEFHPDGTIVPVEYKHGPKRKSEHAELQLCAQAMCLEEMFDRPVTRGAVYSSTSHQRREVELTDALRRKTAEVVGNIRTMLSEQTLPPPLDDSRCPNCSLVHACLPSGVRRLSSVEPASVYTPREGEVVA